jgi:hypothetical protein
MHHAVRIKLQIIIYIIYTLTKIYINYKKKKLRLGAGHGPAELMSGSAPGPIRVRETHPIVVRTN